MGPGEKKKNTKWEESLGHSLLIQLPLQRRNTMMRASSEASQNFVSQSFFSDSSLCRAKLIKAQEWQAVYHVLLFAASRDANEQKIKGGTTLSRLQKKESGLISSFSPRGICREQTRNKKKCYSNFQEGTCNY